MGIKRIIAGLLIVTLMAVTSFSVNADDVDVTITKDYPMNYGLGVYYKTCNGVFYDSHREWPQDAN